MSSFLNDDHYCAFGRIVFWYATVEVGIKYCVAGMLQVPLENAMITSAPYTAYHLNSVAKSLAAENLAPPWSGQLISIINKWNEYTNIRTCVAHHRWRAGVREGSIRPTFFEVKTGEAVVKGFAEKDRDYTAKELSALATELSLINESIKKFLVESGLMASIKKNTPANSPRDATDSETAARNSV
jgi:hypothetical protein